MTEPIVDVIIPLHRSERPVLASVASASTYAQGIATQVTVVLHNVRLSDSTLEQLQSEANVIRCDDGVPSPSGPRNLGFATTAAPFVFFLDSDDQLAPQCLRRLHDVAFTTGSDVVLPSIRHGDRYVGTPLVVSRGTDELDIIRHQLFLRSHSFALLRRRTLAQTQIRFPEGIRTGEDLMFMARLYAVCRTAMALDAVYLLSDHQLDRVSTTPLPASEKLAAVRALLCANWVLELPEDQRQALVRRILSVNLAGSFRRALQAGQSPDVDVYRELRDLALERSRGARRMLSVRDRATLRFRRQAEGLHAALQSKFFGAVPSSVAGATSTQGPLMLEARAWLTRHRRRRSDLQSDGVGGAHADSHPD